MKKLKLLVLPVVLMMASCNKPAAGYNTKESLPAGGEAVEADVTDEAKRSAYEAQLQAITDSVPEILNNSVTKVSLDVDLSVKNFDPSSVTMPKMTAPVAAEEEVPSFKVNASLKGGVDVYVAAPTATATATAAVVVRGLTAKVSGIPQLNGKEVGIDGLNLAAYYRVETVEETTVAKVYLDLSDASVKRNLKNIADFAFSQMETAPQIDVGQMFDTLLPGGKGFITLPPMEIGGESEESESLYITDVVGFGTQMGLAALTQFVSGLTVDLDKMSEQTAAFLPEVKVWKEGNEVTRIGAAMNVDAIEMYKQQIIAQAAEQGVEPTEEQINQVLDALPVKSAKAGVSVLVGTTTGATNIAPEEISAKASIETKDGGSIQGSVKLAFAYNAQAGYTPLTDAQAATYTNDITQIISSFMPAGGGEIE